ncbi:hypothetical protein DMA11_05615 [Marinilabiliaceae bacterium JC017]|nr:hypothetical protein DMA11_05615 [Marinilabiliaceae bacterium JC017]
MEWFKETMFFYSVNTKFNLNLTLMKIARTLSMLFVILIAHQTYGQFADTTQIIPQRKQIKYLDVRFENGAMLSDDTEFGDQIVNSSYYNGFDIRLGFRKSDPDDVYSNVYRRPYLGVGFYSSTFHNNDVGSPNALYFFMTMPFAFENNKKLTFSYTGAFGLSYNFNPYDSINNPINTFIGSYRNCYVHLGLVMNYKISDRWAVNGTVGFKHFSNGAFKLPNMGINLIPATVAVSYRLNPNDVVHQRTYLPEYIKHGLVNVTFSAGSKNYAVGDQNYLKTVLGVNYLRQVNYKYRIGLGMDFFYSPHADKRNDSDKSDFSKSVSYALVGSWEWVINKNLYVPIGIGAYLHRNDENGETSTIYERVGLRYRFADHYCAGLTIKAHSGTADFFEWTVGYTFHRDKNKY